jgi:hypothetical protein
MPFESFDSMDYSAARAPGQDGQKPPAHALGMRPMVYLGTGWYAGAAADARVNAAGAFASGRRIPPGSLVMLDFEPYLHRMVDWSGRNLAPHADRARFAAAISRTVYLVRAACPSATIVTYQSLVGTFNADNGDAWMRAYRDTNEAVYIEPHPGAPNGIGNLFDAAVVSFYRCYSDQRANTRRVEGIAAECRRLYPEKRLLSVLWERYPQSYDVAALRFDIMEPPHIADMIGLSRRLADSEIWWGSNLYGRKGLVPAERNKFGYAVEGGNGWDDSAPWWQEARKWLPIPSNHTIDAASPGPTFRRREDREA